MKLSSFDTKTKANGGAEVELKNVATGGGSGVYFTILGTDGDRYRELQAERSRGILDKVKKRGTDAIPSNEEIDRSACEMLAKCTVGWRGLEDDSGPVPFSYEAAFDIYMKYPRIRDQINVAMADPANFLMG